MFFSPQSGMLCLNPDNKLLPANNVHVFFFINAAVHPAVALANSFFLYTFFLFVMCCLCLSFLYFLCVKVYSQQYRNRVSLLISTSPQSPPSPPLLLCYILILSPVFHPTVLCLVPACFPCWHGCKPTTYDVLIPDSLCELVRGVSHSCPQTLTVVRV